MDPVLPKDKEAFQHDQTRGEGKGIQRGKVFARIAGKTKEKREGETSNGTKR